MPVSEEREIWFARRFPLARGGARMVPVHWKGYAVFGVFMVAMLVGAAVFIVCMMNGQAALGVALYAAFAVGGASAIFFAVVKRSDNTKTYKEYRAHNAQR